MLEEEVQTNTDFSPYQIRLDVFEGPLDLLLHLIKENKVDIYNIPISKITDQYLTHIAMMEELDLDVAGEFIVMAATLAHIKSKMLVPPDETQDDPEEEGKDPRAELVRRLLEYQKYKNAADQLWGRPMLYRDVFKREQTERISIPKPVSTAADLVEISVFKLVEAFHKLLKNLELTKPHNVSLENISVTECVGAITESIRTSQEGSVRFAGLFEEGTTRQRLVTTFIALLEMLKRGAVRVIQADAFSDIYLMGTPVLFGDWKYDGAEEDYEQQTQLNS